MKELSPHPTERCDALYASLSAINEEFGPANILACLGKVWEEEIKNMPCGYKCGLSVAKLIQEAAQEVRGEFVKERDLMEKGAQNN